MKKSILFLFLIAAISVGAQKYIPFPTENAQWNIHYKVSDGIVIESIILCYSLQGDTIINEKSYKKLYLKTGTSDLPLMKLKGAIREENKRIYLIDFAVWGYMSQVRPLSPGVKNCMKQVTQDYGYGTEYLIYDFNKNQVGDTLYKYQYRLGKIIAVDSVLVQNSYRKRYKIDNYYDEYVVEGIGSVSQGLWGVLTPILACTTNFTWNFVSFSQNNECIYKNTDYTDCVTTARWDDPDYLKTGTQWYYGEIDYNGNITNPIATDNYNSIKSTGDTIINGIKCHTLSQVKGDAGCASYYNTVYVYQSNDTVYLLNSMTKKFSPLYVYGANKGDSWTVTYNSQNDKVTVDSTSSIPAFGISLKVQYVTYFTETSDNSYTYGQKSTIIENIGDPNYFFNSNIRNNFICDEFFVNRTGLRCYVHPDLGTYHVPGTLDCSYVTEVLKHNYNVLKVSLNSSGILTVEGDFGTESSTLEILDLKGSIILKTSVNVSENKINLSQYDKGLYLYRISANGVLLKAGKIVKQ